MGPKIEAALAYLDGGGVEVRIGLPEEMEAVLAGDRGTVIRPGVGPMSGEDPAPFDDEDALSPSFRLTVAFLDRYPRYRDRLSLTPDNARFDPVLWNSSLAALRGLLRNVAEREGLAASDDDIREAVRNLVEGVVLRSRRWDRPPGSSE